MFDYGNHTYLGFYTIISIMFKQFLILSSVLVALLVGWCVYEKSQWPIDYLSLPAGTIKLGPLDTSFEQHIIPQLFANATIITNDTHLRFPEDIAVTNEGIIYSGLNDGTVVRISPAGQIENWVEIKGAGQIYGNTLNKAENFFYCATENFGLLEVNLVTREWTSILKELNGEKLILNSLTFNADDSILYVTRTGPVSMRFSTKEVFLKHHKGSILALNMATKQVEVVLDEIAFPNGIAYESSRQAVLFSELNYHRIVRLFVEGPRKGQTEILTENIFGVGDNLKLNAEGDLLVAIPTTRDPLLQLLSDKPAIRKLIMWLPERLILALVQKRAGGIKINTKTGKITDYIFGGTVKTSFITTILEKNGKTYFASLTKPTIVVLDDSTKQAARELHARPSSDL